MIDADLLLFFPSLVLLSLFDLELLDTDLLDNEVWFGKESVFVKLAEEGFEKNASLCFALLEKVLE